MTSRAPESAPERTLRHTPPRRVLVTGAANGDLRGEDRAFAAVIAHLVATAPLGPDEIAAEVLAALDRGEELILPDAAARAAYDLKPRDRAAYDAQLRHQAQRLESL